MASGSAEWFSAGLALKPSNARAVEERFHLLASEWKERTQFLSSSVDRALDPAYQQIIGMGPDAVPLILKELETEPEHWFWALKAITGEDPVPPDSIGKIRKMTEAWLAWGRAHGYR